MGSGRNAEGSARTPPRAVLVTAFLRTFAVQGSWNYRTLLGGGLAHAMLPLLKWIYAGDPVALRDSLQRHASYFNGHPYLCGLAVTALARLEVDGREASEIVRFRTALCGPLGAVGDRTVWAAWRPFCLLAAVAGHLAGLSAPVSAAVFVVVYNMGHVWVRVWGFREGWRRGFRVGEAIANFPMHRPVVWMSLANVVLIGLVATGLAIQLPGTGFSREAAVGLAGGVGLLAYVLPALGARLSMLLLLAALGAWLF